MRCLMCNRPLLREAAKLTTRGGVLWLGPKCAIKAGLMPIAVRQRSASQPRQPKPEVQRDPATVDWVNMAQEGTKSGAGAVFSVGVVHG